MFEVILENADTKLAQIYIPNCEDEMLQSGGAKIVLTMPSLIADQIEIIMYELTTGRIARFGCDLAGSDV